MTSPSSQRMRVQRYIPDRMYGFLGAGTGPQVFFHLRAFHGGVAHGIKVPPLPIVGEPVDVVVERDPLNPENLRAARVTRVVEPVEIAGRVEMFDVTRGYGFVRGADGISYYLHRSEVIDGKIPLVDQPVLFYAAERQDKARACHVRICPEG